MLRTTRRFYIILLSLVFSIIGWIFINDDIFVQFSVLSTLLILFCLIWTLICTNGIEVVRHSRYSRQKVGDFFEENITVTNHSPFWHFLLEVRDLSPNKDIKASRLIASIGPHQTRLYNSYQFLRKRGDIQLGPFQVSSGDPLGLFVSERISQNKSHLFVLPFFEEITRQPYKFGQLSGGTSLKLPALETSPDASGIREYHPGDPLNRIHWPNSMKRNRLIVKEFDQNPHGSAWIVIDADKFVHIKEQNIEKNIEIAPSFWRFDKKNVYKLPRDTFEYSVSTAATLTEYLIHDGKQVGLLFSGKNSEIIPPEKGERQLSKILDCLTHLQPNGEIPLAPFLETNIALHNAGDLVIIITTSLANRLLSVAESFRRKNIQLLFIILNNPSFNGSHDKNHVVRQLKSNRMLVVEIFYNHSIKNLLQRSLI